MRCLYRLACMKSYAGASWAFCGISFIALSCSKLLILSFSSGVFPTEQMRECAEKSLRRIGLHALRLIGEQTAHVHADKTVKTPAFGRGKILAFGVQRSASEKARLKFQRPCPGIVNQYSGRMVLLPMLCRNLIREDADGAAKPPVGDVDAPPFTGDGAPLPVARDCHGGSSCGQNHAGAAIPTRFLILNFCHPCDAPFSLVRLFRLGACGGCFSIHCGRVSG